MASLTATPNPAIVSTLVSILGQNFYNYKTRLMLDGVGATSNTFRPRKDGKFAVGIMVGSVAKTQILVAEQWSGASGAWVEKARVSIVVQTSPPVEPPPPNPSGQAMPVGDLPGWRQVFTDDFNVAIPEGQFPAATNGRWGAYPYGWKDSSKFGTYDPSIVSFHDGLLDVYIRTTAGIHRVASFGPITPQYQLYGRYAIRFKADTLAGYKAAWLLWPQSEVWPRDGEIDFPEGDFDRVIEAYMHRQGATTGGDQDAFVTTTHWTDWHTAVTEWTPSAVKFYLDGALIGTSTSRIPNTAMRWQIQNETRIIATPPADSSQGHILIDWVAQWAYTP